MASKGRTLTVNRKKYLSPPREKRANVSVKNTQDGNVGQTEAFQQNVCATTGQIIRKLSSVIFFFILVTV